MKIIFLSLALCGCSTMHALLPNTVAPEFEHMSHATQHAPMTDHPGQHYETIAQITATWNLTKHFYVNASEGVSLNPYYNDAHSYGEIEGPREQFTLRVGYTFRVKD